MCSFLRFRLFGTTAFLGILGWCSTDFLFFLGNLLFFAAISFLVVVNESLVAREYVTDLQLFKSITLLLFFLQKSQNARFPLLVRFFTLLSIFLSAEHLARWCKFPITVAVFKCVFVGFFKDVNVELAAKNHVLVHGFGSDFSNFSFSELQKGIASRSSSLD